MFNKKTIYKIKGMTCEHCVMRVKKAIESLKNVKKVKVNLKKGEAIVKGEPDDEKVKEAVDEAGYKVTEIL